VLKRLWILTLLQLSNKMKLKISNQKRFLAGLGLNALAIVVVTVAMIFLLYFIDEILSIPVNLYFVIFFIFATQVAAIITCLPGLMVELYLSKDNQILLAYPAHHNEVFLSKLLVFYLNEFIKNLFFLLPLLVAFGFINSQGIGYYLNILSMLFVLPLLPILIDSLLSIPFAHLKRLLSQNKIVSLILIFVSLLSALVLLTLLLIRIPTPIRIVQLYHRFVTGIALFMQSSAKYSLIYENVGKLLFGVDVLKNYGLIAGVIVCLVVLVAFISRPLYFNLACKSTEQTIKKTHKAAIRSPKSLYWTFVQKEWILSTRNIGELLTNYITVILFPFVMAIMNYIYLGIGRSTFGNHLVMGFDIMIALLMVMGANTASASAITVEGFEFILVKMAPTDTKVLCWAKVTFNLVFSTIMILLGFLVFNYVLPKFSDLIDQWLQNRDYGGIRYTLPQFKDVDIWLTFVTVAFVNAGHILWSFQIDLLSPKLSDYAATGSLSNNPNTSKAIVIDLILSLLFGAGSALLLIDDYATGWIRILAIAFGFFLARLYLFKNSVRYYFTDIEF
jgi:hypothetical protein